jgi:hypothetical protein
MTNVTHKFLSTYLFLFLTLYMFRAHRAHHQERQIVSIQPLVTVTLCRWPCRVHTTRLWGTASNSNIDILERFQSKVLRIITDAPWYVPKTMIRRDLQVLPVRQEARNYSITYRHRLKNHPNMLAKSLLTGPALSDAKLQTCKLDSS